ncbi:MAG: carboxypeptidase-like regulatory domain-containing protein, partial [Acidobacteria bacterium]|nr:carboxypeptidase-like regulatory domain-containing protein [Acidobacteriota bacterium]
MRRSKKITETCLLVLVSLLLFSLCSPMAAQTDRGSITGTVTDPSGSVVAGVTVTVTSAEMGTKLVTHTTAAGTYSLPQVPAGTHQVEAELTGFKKAVVQGLRVGVLQK